MKKHVAVLFLNFLFTLGFSQLPDTDIWLMDMSYQKDSTLLTPPVNITNRIGYDNQPAFSPDSRYLLFSSIRDDKQSDIYKYNLISKTTSQFTYSPESEYSPTFMPDGENISVVMVEADSTQRLWKIPITEGEASLVMKDIDSIGYHYWIDTNRLALIMITDPVTLEVVNVKTQQQRIVSKGVGRCMKKIKENSLLFVQKTSEESGLFSELNLSTFSVSNFNCSSFITLENSEDFAYSENLFMAKGSRIYTLSCQTGKWILVSDLAKNKIKNIKRISISNDRKKMAIVAESL